MQQRYPPRDDRTGASPSSYQSDRRHERGRDVARYREDAYGPEPYRGTQDRSDWGQIIRAVSDRMEELRDQYQVISEKLGKVEVAFERVSVLAGRLPELQQNLDNKVDKPYFQQAQDALRERDIRQDAAIKALEDNQQKLLDCPRRLDKLENAPQRWAPWVAIAVAFIMPLAILFAQKIP